VTNLGRNRVRGAGIDLEIIRHLPRALQRCGSGLKIDRGRQDARLDVGRNRIEIVGGCEPPAVGTGVEKAEVAEMIIGIRDQDAEYDAPLQLAHVLLRRSAVLTKGVHESQIAARLVT
jgi:hypothetical protein